MTYGTLKVDHLQSSDGTLFVVSDIGGPKADLIDGKVPAGQLPSIAITDFLGEAADATALVALVGEKGDWAIRTDTGSTWVIVDNDGSAIGDWVELASPASPVSSVNGQVGAVVLAAADVNAATTAQGALADSALQPGDIGSSVQAYNAATVVDAAYVHTDNNYSSAEKSKLAGIAAGAEVNVNADWAASSGDAQILNKPSLGSAAAQDVGYFATAAQGALADSALQAADIGVSVQAYDANAVSDATYVHTDNNYTTSEKSKLAGIEAGAEVNVNADWSASSGDAQILNKPALGTASAEDVGFFATAAQGSLADTALQPEDIGLSVQAYDANAVSDAAYVHTDNNYTTSEKSKLAGIEAGAEVNVNADWNAASGDAAILNKPTLGTAAAEDVAAFASAAQGSLADTALQPEDVGISLQAYDANIVSDAGYVHTDNNYTSAEKTKLAGIAAGAEVNVNADWSASTGDAAILNKPVLGTASAEDVGYFASAAQGSLADSAVQPGDDISDLTNDAGYITSGEAPVQSVAGKTGTVTLAKGDVGLGNVSNTSDADKPVSTATQAALDAKADLVGGLIPTAQLPSIAVSEYLGSVASQSAMLALSGQKGDWAIRSDLGSTWVITDGTGSQLANWVQLATPADAISSVNGFTGAVVLGPSDVGAATSAQGALADTALQPGDIGTDVQAYNANTVVDANYVHTDNNYTSAEKSKLAGIAAGAEVNINADWSASSGDAQILNKPTTLSGYGITDAQPLDGDLTSIAGLAGTSGLLKKTAANTWSLDTSTYLTGNQSITVSGDASGSGSTSISLTLANSGVTAGTYNDSATAVRPFSVDAKGRLTGIGSAVTITPGWSSITSKPTTLSGYGITDAQPLDADLTAIAGLAGTSGILKKTAADTWSLDTSTYLTSNQSISVSGDATGSGSTSITLTLANSGVTAGTYNDSGTAVRPFTVDSKGRLTSIGSAVTITPGWSSITSKPTTLSGYGITDAASSTHGHGNITNGGAIGSTSGLPIITGASGILQAGSFGTTAGTFCQGNDSRLSDTRNTPNSVTFNSGGAGAASGQTFNGGSAVTVSYNTVGAPSTTGGNASGTWGISITGNAATVTNGVYTTSSGVVTSAMIADGTIVDGDISASAAIADSKLATISTAGKVSGGAITSGTIGGSTAINTSGSITTSAAVNDGIGWLRRIPQNAQTAAYSLVGMDVGKHVSITTGGVTVPASIFQAGDAVTIFNNSASNQTITQGASVTMYLAGTATTGNRTLAQRGICTLMCVAANTFVISGAGLS